MTSPTRMNCPSCHTPVAIERYERACGSTSSYLVCPECDYTFLLTEAQRVAVSGWGERTKVGANVVAMSKGASGAISQVRPTIHVSGSSIEGANDSPFSVSVEGRHLQTEFS